MQTERPRAYVAHLVGFNGLFLFVIKYNQS
nr:MAG TPA: hypothetical protein [Bacteriophage sp.]